MKILNKSNTFPINSKIKNLILITLLLTSISIITLFTIPVEACQTVGTYESDFETPKTTFMQGEFVYGKETYTKDTHLRLRIRDPGNNVVFCSNPVYSTEIRCSYRLDDYATIGVWNIQVGTYKGGLWYWLTKTGDISYFNVTASPKYILDTYVIGSGTVSKNPNQADYANGTVVTLTAEPESGWKFDQWSGDLSGSSNPIDITMDSGKSVTANFIEKSNGGGSEGSSNGGSSGSSNSQSVGSNIGEDKENIPPVAYAGELYEGLLDSEIFFNGSLSYDPDGYITLYEWDFGDGTSDLGQTVYHSYSNADVYTVCLNVTDDDGAFNHSEASVVVTQPNRSPSNPEINGPTKCTKGIDYTYTVVSTDDDGDSIQYIIEWGDVNIDESEFLPNGTMFTITHKWTSSRNFIIRATANDNQTISLSEITIIVEEPKPEEENIALIYLALLAVILLIITLIFIKRIKGKK